MRLRLRPAALFCGRLCISRLSTDRDMTPTTSAASYRLIRYALFTSRFLWHCCQERVWVISIARLWTLPPLHLQPIDVIVFDDPCMEILS